VPTINQEKSGVLFESKRKRFHFFYALLEHKNKNEFFSRKNG
jgi:hypothetical protein